MSNDNPRAGVILVAERFNRPYETAFKVISRERWNVDGGVRWLSISRRLGVFRRGRGLLGSKRLESIGCHWHESCNLTPPAEQGVRFDSALADQVAALIRDMAWWRILCVGVRVAKCFGICGAVRFGHLYEGRYVVAPHPSGLSRWWNFSNRDEHLLTTQLMLRALNPATEEAGLRCCVCLHPILEEDIEQLCPVCFRRTCL